MMIERQSQRSASPTSLALHHSGEEMDMMTTHIHTPATVRNLPFDGVILTTCSCGARSRSDNRPIVGGTLDVDDWYIATPDDSRAAYDLLQTEGHLEVQEPRDMYDEFDGPSGQ